ncbi:hypothetical protein [Amycolatopsis thermoflava]|uniref:hypothetical protein n=1 Tax=Amycolatopsis thermoflava TaxID=84480 RepID=UPI003F4A112C
MVHQRRLKIINFSIDGQPFECQIQTWNLDPGVQDGDRQYTFCSDPNQKNSFVEETDDEPTLELTFFSDWRSNGLSDYLWAHANQEADFVLDHHPDIPGEHVRWTGTVLLKPPPVGGDARATETSEVTLQIIGTLGDGLEYERVA